jgi:hypothetical protein
MYLYDLIWSSMYLCNLMRNAAQWNAKCTERYREDVWVIPAGWYWEATSKFPGNDHKMTEKQNLKFPDLQSPGPLVPTWCGSYLLIHWSRGPFQTKLALYTVSPEATWISPKPTLRNPEPTLKKPKSNA